MSQINEILAKNLEYIKSYDEELCNKIASIDTLTADIQIVYTALKEANLAINGIAINEQAGAELESQRIVDSLPHNHRGSIHVVLGLGFGYLFSRTVEVSKGAVILYEPNIELLRVALEMVDMSQFLNKPRVFITNSIEMLEKHFGDCFLSNSKSAILSCSYYKSHGIAELNKLIKKLGQLQGMYQSNERQRALHGHAYAKNVCKNLFDLKNCTPIEELKDKFKDTPAIIAAAGPSLSENIEILKQYRDKFLLFGVSTSFATLMRNDITPDFVSIVEMFDATGMIKNFSPENISLIAEPYINNNVLNLPFKNKIITSSVENNANIIYSKFIKEQRAYFETKGTVAYNALYAAMFMGCNPIILVGQDLAYIDGECYSKNSQLSPIKCLKNENGWEICATDYETLKNNLYAHKNISEDEIKKNIAQRIAHLNKELVIGKTKNGDEVPTTITFSLFAEYYKSFAQRFSKTIQLYNTTEKGLDIGDFDYEPLVSILEKLPDIKIDVNLDELSSSNIFNIEFLKDEIQKISYICKKIYQMHPAFTSWLVKIRKKTLTKELLKETKLILGTYASLDEKGTKESLIYKEITQESKLVMSYVFEWLDSLNIQTIKRLWFNLRVFYVKDYERLVATLDILNTLKERLENESSIAKG